MNKEQARLKLGDKKLTGDRNQCPNCGELFNSSSAFDKHRKPISWFVGISKEELKSLAPIPRRCLSLAEMSHLGMLKNPYGFLVTEAMDKGYLERVKQEQEDTEEPQIAQIH